MTSRASLLGALLVATLAAGPASAAPPDNEDPGPYEDPGRPPPDEPPDQPDEPDRRGSKKPSYCTSDMGCLPWQQCTVSLGDCGSALSPYDVCTGRCAAGRSLRYSVRAGGRGWTQLQPGAIEASGVQAFAAFELVPPVLRGHLSIAGELATRRRGRDEEQTPTGRVTLTAWLRPHRGLHLGPTIGWTGGPSGTGSLRLQYFPRVHLTGLIPARFFAVGAEVGLAQADVRRRDAMEGLPAFFALTLDLWGPPLSMR